MTSRKKDYNRTLDAEIKDYNIEAEEPSDIQMTLEQQAIIEMANQLAKVSQQLSEINGRLIGIQVCVSTIEQKLLLPR